MKIYVVGGESFTDIDVLACTIAYAELLRLEGKDAEPLIPGVLNASCPPMIRTLPLVYKTAPAVSDADYVLVDISDRTHMAKCAPVDRVIEVYDHRAGFQDFWNETLGPDSHIELVGACATQIWEQYVKRGHTDKISTTSANLLATAILSNTLNFGAQVTHARDHVAFEELKKHVDMTDDWQSRYFNEVQQISLQGDIREVIKNDTKSLVIPGLGYDVVMGQMELWQGSDFVRTQQMTITGALESFGIDDWFMSVPSISEGKNYLYCTNQRLKGLLAEVIGAKFDGNTGTTDKMWLRKEIRKKLFEKFERKD
jgi:inorganic pyrophosphatase/exopolyphosphatase